MNTETFSKTRIGQTFLRFIGAVMESRLRYKLFGPEKILQGAGMRPGLKVLEVGCGTGFFTIPAARILGTDGLLIALDILTESVELVTQKVRAASLDNVRVIKGDVLDTRLEKADIDQVLLFGVIPAPVIPMPALLTEMHRILRPDGVMSVWPHSWVHKSIISSGLFKHTTKLNGVMNYQRINN